MGKITTIYEKVPQVTTLPDGYYIGMWTGNVIEVNYKAKWYSLQTEERYYGGEISVVVSIEDGIMSFEELNN